MSDPAIAFWRRLDQPGHDTAMLVRSPNGWVLSGVAVFREKGFTGLCYRVELAEDYSTRSAQIEGMRHGKGFRHEFRRDENGWHMNAELQPGLADLVHLDFGFTPSTNLQQLRHAALAVGDEAEIPAAWFDIGEQGLMRLPQRYRRLGEDRYKYESPTVGYAAVLKLAPSGFVHLYPGLWEMELE